MIFIFTSDLLKNRIVKIFLQRKRIPPQTIYFIDFISYEKLEYFK